MPYMESCFKTLIDVRLKGLSQFTGWIKPGSYYHGVVARKGQLHMCLHLAGTEPPKGLQICPSQTCSVTQKKEETPTTSLHMPGKESGTTQGACSDSPAPMETGGVGDGQSWAEQAEASTEEEWRRGRPTKHHWSASRKQEGRSTNPFPLQDSEGRHEVVQQLYRHAGELTPAHHNVATQGMSCQYPGMQLGKAESLNNQVLCMISEYHLTCLSQGSSCISPVLPEAAKDLLPPIEMYLADDSFHGTRDLRVEEKTKTLRVAVWLHPLDMAAAKYGTASLSLDRGQRVHCTMSKSSGIGSKESSKTSLRLTEWSLANLLKRRLREIWNRSGRTSKVLRLPYLIMNPASEGPRFNQKEPWPVKAIHPTLVLRMLKRQRWLLHQ